ncbi:MAG TPA: UDP-N-acetylmuramoyl-L-alanine--D-glutamate ligase [Candidatus Babeliales bacterium]|nr:UDP-N-acetylmuramoyl-L-alanine--D-glutamate ligase [Candidatus Babeliales bacterium]HLC07237.1 UDP-N-acetylmuramoyl-L-alanine--D-glutamate ligase [Candidatus Babeliales bacterium]
MNIPHKNAHLGIWGFGKVGRSAAHYLHEQGYCLSVMDKRVPTAQEQEYVQEKNITWYNEHEQETFFNSCDFIIPSPGINISPLCYATHSAKWVHELDFFYQQCNKPIIAITGSIGKTSVTHILAQLFKELSIPVAVGGNIGTPIFDLIAQQNNVDYTLLEASSFQLMHCTNFAPTLSIWTNFYPNHLDYHPSEAEYFSAKYNIVKHQKNNSLSLIPFTLREKIPAVPIHHIRAYFTITIPGNDQLLSLKDNEQLYYIKSNMVVRYAHGIHTPLMLLTPNLLHLSFIDNMLLIVSVCDLLKISSNTLETVATTINLPEHRVEYSGTIHNVDFYNDSKATTTASTLAAVEKLKNRPLHLFLGGLSKGVDRAPLIAQLKNQVKHIYCFGKEADMLYSMCFDNAIPSTHYANLDSAIKNCIDRIQSGDCVLLSPAGSSYDLYENYEQRGKHFKELIKSYMEKNYLSTRSS